MRRDGHRLNLNDVMIEVVTSLIVNRSAPYAVYEIEAFCKALRQHDFEPSTSCFYLESS